MAFSDLRQRFELAKHIIATHYPDKRTAPAGLQMALIKAFGEAELRGYDECLRYFTEGTAAANDDRPSA